MGRGESYRRPRGSVSLPSAIALDREKIALHLNMLGFNYRLGPCGPRRISGLINTLLGKVFGTKNERVVKALVPQVVAINALEPRIQKLTDAELRAKTEEFRRRIQERLARFKDARAAEVAGKAEDEDDAEPDVDRQKRLEKEQYAALQEVLNAILVEAFAVVREAGRRVLNMRHFDVQLIGGMVLHQGTISEMKTGEGKTLVATLPVYLNALSGRGVHVVTVNDYLAKRDSKWMGKLYSFLGLTVGVIVHNLTVSDEGWEKVEKLLGIGNIADPENWALKHHVETAVKAHALYKRDVEYVVKDGEVIIVDEFTGRLMPGRRWSDGLHQAIEAKENVKIERENQTLATITFQNYFRMYKKLAGMTGTAETEAAEFEKIYKLDVVSIPTNKKLIRHEYQDVVYRTEAEKFEAAVNGIIQEDGTKTGGIRQYYESGQPVLVGSISIEKSEKIAELLRKFGIPHQVLNAKQHEREAKIISQEGRKGAVTVSTNMAGRGTDILLGGNPEAMTREHFLKNKLAIPYAPAGAVIGGNGASSETPGEAESGASSTGAIAAQSGGSSSGSAAATLAAPVASVPM